MNYRPVVLVVLDGWGVAIPSQANGITQANTPAFDSFVATYPTVTLQASGEATGLPWGEVGNSEVGHMSIGAGRIVLQELSRIGQTIANRSFFSNNVFLQAVDHVQKTDGTLHLMGLLSPGGIHSHSDHLNALLELSREKEVHKVAIHAILDGRDVPYASATQYIASLREKLLGTNASLATLSGRFYAMDRDNHWDRIEKAYRAMVHGESDRLADDPLAAIKASYEAEVYDEQLYPTVITEEGAPRSTIKDGDAVIFFNIRADRARQLTHAFVKSDFDKFEHVSFSNLFFATMTEYEKNLPVAVAFPPQVIQNSLAQVISDAGLKQLHIAETEKYAHITYFLNDGREEPFPYEQRVMIPSPSVDSYDAKPEMSAHEITTQALKALESGEYQFLAMNFANADMVGHTGNMKATFRAIETLDGCLDQISKSVLARGGAMLITADHGNAESLLDLQTGKIDKEHSNNPVPCIMIAKEFEGRSVATLDISSKDLSILQPSGMLSDVAPTVLALLGIEKPSLMTGNNLLENL
ncbi:2,3-bisphosphoglycerate-independent phosphoglycerate mutase [Candidatus Uhrbacteria bacterium]|nr:2,3-bisphosphoglycerate-independent phosphoglycerate mutase [Candidatus Uhrbacteria bacterium]